MNKNTKAELFRITHCGMSFYIYIILSILGIIITNVICSDSLSNDLYTTITNSYTMYNLFVPMFMGTFVGVTLSRLYQHRTYFYEVMYGTDPHRIITSKLLVYSIFGLLILIPSAIMMAIIGSKNGVGEIKHPVIFFLFFTIILFHMVFRIVLFSMIFRNIVAGSVISIVLMYIAVFGTMILNGGDDEKVSVFNDFFVTNQWSTLFTFDYSTRFMILVPLTAIVYMTVLYIVVYNIHAKKLFK